MNTFFIAAGVALFLMMLPALFRVVFGPTVIDRIVAINVIGTKTAVLLVVIAWFSTNGTETEIQSPSVTPGFLSASYHQETRRDRVGYVVHSEVHESRTSDNGMYAVLRIEDRKPIHR